MIEIAVVTFIIIFIGFGTFKEYRNPLWTEIVAQGKPFSGSTEGKSSVQMVFFWKGGESYRSAEEADYYNAMDIYLCTEGVLFKCPPFLARKTVLLPWGKIEQGDTFIKFMAQRRALHIKGTDLYVSVTCKTTKQSVWALAHEPPKS